MQKGLALSGGSAHSEAWRSGEQGTSVAARVPILIFQDQVVSNRRSEGRRPITCAWWDAPPSSTLIAQFARLAEMLDAAGLGPADYLYSSLKWRLQRPGINQYPLPRPLLKLLWQASNQSTHGAARGPSRRDSRGQLLRRLCQSPSPSRSGS